jgi:hypothetical protein
MRVAAPVALTEDQKRTLQQWARGRSLPARQVERARVVLLAAAGKQYLEIAAEIGISNQKAARWRKRFLKVGLAGLGKGCTAARPHADNHTGQSAGGGPENHAGETLQCDSVEHPDNSRRGGSQ